MKIDLSGYLIYVQHYYGIVPHDELESIRDELKNAEITIYPDGYITSDTLNDGYSSYLFENYGTSIICDAITQLGLGNKIFTNY